MNDNIHPVDLAVGQRVRMARLGRKMSQSRLASSLGVTFQQLQKYEKGTNRISASRLFEIAKALELEISSFFADAEARIETGTGFFEDNFDRLDISILHQLSKLKDRAVKRHIHGILSALVREAEATSEGSN